MFSFILLVFKRSFGKGVVVFGKRNGEKGKLNFDKDRMEIAPNTRFPIKTFAHFKINHYLCGKLSNNRFMSATDYLNNAQAWLAQQSQRTIDYQWEIQHHNQMHKTYETSL